MLKKRCCHSDLFVQQPRQLGVPATRPCP